jgi:hypothetical protein
MVWRAANSAMTDASYSLFGTVDFALRKRAQEILVHAGIPNPFSCRPMIGTQLHCEQPKPRNFRLSIQLTCHPRTFIICVIEQLRHMDR